MSESIRRRAVFWRVFVLLPGLLTLAGCGWPFDCETKLIEVTFPLTLEDGGEHFGLTPRGAVTLGNVGNDYEGLESFLVKDATQNMGATWTVAEPETTHLSIAFTAQGPLHEGERHSLRTTFAGGGWGSSSSLSDGSTFAIHLVKAEYVATSADGTVEVLNTQPLELRIDVEVSNEQQQKLRLAGDMKFQSVTRDETCT